jgi:hypothetical protein
MYSNWYIFVRIFSIDSFFMLRALLCPSSGGTVCTAIGILLCVLCRLVASRVGVKLLIEIN